MDEFDYLPHPPKPPETRVVDDSPEYDDKFDNNLLWFLYGFLACLIFTGLANAYG